ncbi:MAG TPA: hypothetical protein VEI73_02535 [Candidatus Acidoferrum sp.]|nr:hypothetical protein [Candidatus Acidoferrum sp.]
MNTFQTLIALALLIYVLCVIVQAIQEFVKNLLNTKADVMAQTVETFMGDSLKLPQVQDALKVRGLNITALESLNKQDFRSLLDGVQFLPGQLDGIVKSAQADAEKIKDNIAASYEGFRSVFQDAYTKRNKLIVLILSFIVVLALNANAIILYDQISSDQAAQQALVASAAKPPANASDRTSQDPLTAAQNTRAAIQKDLQDYPVLIRSHKYGKDHDDHPYAQIPGLLVMGFLVSLGAPFWNDVLKGMTGINNSFNTNKGKAS